MPKNSHYTARHSSSMQNYFIIFNTHLRGIQHGNTIRVSSCHLAKQNHQLPQADHIDSNAQANIAPNTYSKLISCTASETCMYLPIKRRRVASVHAPSSTTQPDRSPCRRVHRDRCAVADDVGNLGSNDPTCHTNHSSLPDESSAAYHRVLPPIA